MAEQNPDATTTRAIVDEETGAVEAPQGTDMMGSVRDPGGTNMEPKHRGASGANDTSGSDTSAAPREPQTEDEVIPGNVGDTKPSAAPDPEDNDALRDKTDTSADPDGQPEKEEKQDDFSLVGGETGAAEVGEGASEPELGEDTGENVVNTEPFGDVATEETDDEEPLS